MNRVKWFGLVVFSIIGIASFVYYRERVIYVDSAYYAFNLFNNNFPAAEHNRFALYLYQLIPWLLFNSGASFKVLLISFSLSHALLHLISFLLLLKMKQARLAALLVLMQILTYRECFFLSVNETALAMSAVLLLAGYLNFCALNSKSYTQQITVIFLCSSIAMLSHPMAMVLLPFVIGFHLIQNHLLNNFRYQLMLVLPIVAGFILKKMISKDSGYEDDLFNQLKSAGTILSHPGDYYSFDFFFGRFRLNSYFFKVYIFPILLMIPLVIRFIKHKKWLLMGYYLFSVLGFLLLILVLFNRGDGTIFMEKNFTPWVLVALYPYAFTGISEDMRLPELAICIGLVIFSFSGVMKVQPMYSKRLYLMDRLITEKNPLHANKLIVQDSTINHDEWLGIWALPYETILLSKVKNLPVTTAKIYHNEEHINKELHRKDIFLGADFIPVLPENYLLRYAGFRIPDQPYTEIRNP